MRLTAFLLTAGAFALNLRHAPAPLALLQTESAGVNYDLTGLPPVAVSFTPGKKAAHGYKGFEFDHAELEREILKVPIPQKTKLQIRELILVPDDHQHYILAHTLVTKDGWIGIKEEESEHRFYAFTLDCASTCKIAPVQHPDGSIGTKVPVTELPDDVNLDSRLGRNAIVRTQGHVAAVFHQKNKLSSDRQFILGYQLPKGGKNFRTLLIEPQFDSSSTSINGLGAWPDRSDILLHAIPKSAWKILKSIARHTIGILGIAVALFVNFLIIAAMCSGGIMFITGNPFIPLTITYFEAPHVASGLSAFNIEDHFGDTHDIRSLVTGGDLYFDGSSGQPLGSGPIMVRDDGFAVARPGLAGHLLELKDHTGLPVASTEGRYVGFESETKILSTGDDSQAADIAKQLPAGEWKVLQPLEAPSGLMLHSVLVAQKVGKAFKLGLVTVSGGKTFKELDIVVNADDDVFAKVALDASHVIIYDAENGKTYEVAV